MLEITVISSRYVRIRRSCSCAVEQFRLCIIEFPAIEIDWQRSFTAIRTSVRVIFSCQPASIGFAFQTLLQWLLTLHSYQYSFQCFVHNMTHGKDFFNVILVAFHDACKERLNVACALKTLQSHSNTSQGILFSVLVLNHFSRYLGSLTKAHLYI